MNIKPLFDRVLAKSLKQPKLSQSGITISSTEKDYTCRAKIVEVGNGYLPQIPENKMQVATNDIIYYEPQVATTLNIDGQEYILIKQTDILAIEKE